MNKFIKLNYHQINRVLKISKSFSVKKTFTLKISTTNMSTLNNNKKFKVYVTQPIPTEAYEILKENNLDIVINEKTPLERERLLNSVKNIDALFCTLNEKINKELLDQAGKELKVVATCSVGVDHIDLRECNERKIPIGYTPGVLTDAVAEYAIALLLTTSRRIPEGLEAATNGEWSTWKIMWMCGPTLKGSTVGIFGLGRIGSAIAKRLKGFEVSKILYNSRNPKPVVAEEFNGEYVSFDNLLAKSDFLICCCAATAETNKIFNKNVFNKMKSNAIFINISRGSTVDQDDLYDALVNKTIFKAGLDVTTPEPLPLDHKLLKLKNCIITPHISSAETNTRTKMAVITAQNIVNALNNKPLVHQIEII